LLLISGLFSLITNIYLLLSDQVYSQDFIQDYLLVKAIINGDNPYLPINQLAEMYFGGLPPTAYPFDHPTPHPASIGILLLPLGSLSYEAAAAVWFGVSVASLGGTVLLLARSSAIGLPRWRFLLIVIALIGWPPVRRELLLGQPMVLITFLVAVAREAVLSGRPMLAGASLGGALLPKPVTWMVVLALPFRRQFRALGTTLVTVLAGALVTVAAVGVYPLIAYVREVLPSVSAVYLASGVNISVSALAWRIFHGTDSYARGAFFTPPLIHAEPFAMTASLIFQGCIVLLMVGMVRKAKDSNQALLASVCLSPVINPIAWGTYLVLTMIPLWYVVYSLYSYQTLPARETCLTILAMFLLSMPLTFWIMVATIFAASAPTPGTPVHLPLLVSFLTFATDVGLVVLGWLVLALRPHPSSSSW